MRKRLTTLTWEIFGTFSRNLSAALSRNLLGGTKQNQEHVSHDCRWLGWNLNHWTAEHNFFLRYRYINTMQVIIDVTAPCIPINVHHIEKKNTSTESQQLSDLSYFISRTHLCNISLTTVTIHQLSLVSAMRFTGLTLIAIKFSK
jgi:hypothetical protein